MLLFHLSQCVKAGLTIVSGNRDGLNPTTPVRNIKPAGRGRSPQFPAPRAGLTWSDDQGVMAVAAMVDHAAAAGAGIPGGVPLTVSSSPACACMADLLTYGCHANQVGFRDGPD